MTCACREVLLTLSLHFGEVYIARERARGETRWGPTAPALGRRRDDQTGHFGVLLPSTGVLVETLLARGGEDDVCEAEAAIDRLAAAPFDDHLVCATSGCCGCGRCWPAPTATRPPTATIGIATAPWRHRLASRGTWSGPRRCHDGGHSATPINYPSARPPTGALSTVG